MKRPVRSNTIFEYKQKIKSAAVCCAAFIILVPVTALAADLFLAAGLFRFEATDYYYPNFYTEAGFRGEIAYTLRGEDASHAVRLLASGYPMDDNIFEPAAEYAYGRRLLSFWGCEVVGEPAGGFQVTKLQYPAPYYPTVDHHFLSFARAGGDAWLEHKFIGASSLAGGYRGRLLYYLGSEFFKDADGQVERFKYVHTPFARLTIRVNERWTLLTTGGIELGGYYDDIFLTPETLPHTRPYFEAGFAYHM